MTFLVVVLGHGKKSPIPIHSIPATTKLENDLPSLIVEAMELQKFKLGANAYLLGVAGP